MMTIEAARLSFDEARKGSIEVGKLADLTMLSANPLTVPDDSPSLHYFRSDGRRRPHHLRTAALTPRDARVFGRCADVRGSSHTYALRASITSVIMKELPPAYLTPKVSLRWRLSMIVSDGWMERGRWPARLAAIVSAAFIFSISVPRAAHADTCTWTGNGASNLWSLSANWTCSGSHLVPQDGDSLVFPASALEFESVNDLTDLIVQSITIDDYRYQLSGNGIFLNQDLTASSPVAGTPSVSLPVTLLQPNTVSCRRRR